jgi:ATP-binding cassette subfamily C (CFTR/MRP) protein 1
MVCYLSVLLSLSNDAILPSSSTLIYCSHLLGMSTVGLAGLSISFALAVTQALNWTVRMASDMEGQMVSVGKQAREEGRKEVYQ